LFEGKAAMPSARLFRQRTVALATGVMLLAAGCAGRARARQPRQALTIINANGTLDICRVLVRRPGDQPWSEVAPIDPIAPGRSRTLRIAHGRWRFRFEACERAVVLDSPPVDVAFTRVVFLLCDGECPPGRAPPGAVIVRHNAESDAWGVSQPTYVPTGRRRVRLVL
jgi:hypothetical protein